jgi:hypothetical protein
MDKQTQRCEETIDLHGTKIPCQRVKHPNSYHFYDDTQQITIWKITGGVATMTEGTDIISMLTFDPDAIRVAQKKEEAEEDKPMPPLMHRPWKE